MQYYYLVSALPDLKPGEPALASPTALSQFIQENLTDRDRSLFRYLLYRNDNKNILHQLRLAEGHADASYLTFHEPAAFAFLDLEEIMQSGDGLPDYMQEFLFLYRRDLLPRDLRARENLLKQMYYRELLQLSDPFLQSYFRFKLDLKNILSALNARIFRFPLAEVLIGENDLTRELQASTAADFGLSQRYPFLESLRESLEARNFENLERQIDSILRARVEELAPERFSRAAVYSYFIQSTLLQRWLALDEKAGAMELEKMIHRILSQASWPIEPQLAVPEGSAV